MGRVHYGNTKTEPKPVVSNREEPTVKEIIQYVDREVIKEVEVVKTVVLEKIVEVVKEIEVPVVVTRIELVEVPKEVIKEVEKVVTIIDTVQLFEEKRKNVILLNKNRNLKLGMAAMIVLSILASSLLYKG